MINTNRPTVGVSQCLLGIAVRYDGRSRADAIIIEELGRHFEFLPVCPEVEAGLGIPRPPVQLTGSISAPKLIGRDDPSVDITGIMQHYCDTKPLELRQLCGFIFKSRSPSCGLNSTPVFVDGRSVTETGRGVFASKMCELYPELPVIEDTDLQDRKCRDRFIEAVYRLQPAIPASTLQDRS